jgi:hypothetical protein
MFLVILCVLLLLPCWAAALLLVALAGDLGSVTARRFLEKLGCAASCW